MIWDMNFLQAWLDALWALLLDSGLWLIVGFLMAGAMHAIVPKGFLERHLAGRGAWPILKASLLGIPLPLCSCSVIPVAAGLRKGGASRGASAAFAISTPQTGEESIPLTWALFGPVYALTRPVAAMITAFTAGLLIERFAQSGQDRAEDAPLRTCGCSGGKAAGAADACCTAPAPTESSCGCHAQAPAAAGASCGCTGQARSGAASGRGCCSSKSAPAPQSIRERIRAGWRHGFVTMPIDLAPWLALGFALAASVSAIIPQGWIESHVGSGLVPMLIMLLIGIPLYICATSSTPLAYSLVVAGLSPGAALVLLLAGPATNVATITWALKDLGTRATAIYLGTIAAVAVATGWVFDALLSGTVRLGDGVGLAAHREMRLAYVVGAVLFVSLLGWALTMRLARSWSDRRPAARGDAHS
ncbi:MAG: SO_0444 family Cu/Zn efflux transporter [Phycisphaerales bacterium]